MSLDIEVFSESGDLVNADDLSLRQQRALILLLLYAAYASDYEFSLESIVDNFHRGFSIKIPYDSRVYLWTSEIIEKRQEIDEQIRPLLARWRLERIGVCTRLILRMALWELQNVDTPATIVINEAVELAKCFAEFEAYKFINGVLDEFVKKLKKTEN